MLWVAELNTGSGYGPSLRSTSWCAQVGLSAIASPQKIRVVIVPEGARAAASIPKAFFRRAAKIYCAGYRRYDVPDIL